MCSCRTGHLSGVQVFRHRRTPILLCDGRHGSGTKCAIGESKSMDGRGAARRVSMTFRRVRTATYRSAYFGRALAAEDRHAGIRVSVKSIRLMAAVSMVFEKTVTLLTRGPIPNGAHNSGLSRTCSCSLHGSEAQPGWLLTVTRNAGRGLGREKQRQSERGFHMGLVNLAQRK